MLLIKNTSQDYEDLLDKSKKLKTYNSNALRDLETNRQNLKLQNSEIQNSLQLELSQPDLQNQLQELKTNQQFLLERIRSNADADELNAVQQNIQELEQKLN